MEWSSQMPPEAVIFTRSGLQAAAVKDGNAELRNIRVTRDLGDAGASRRGSMGHLRRKVDVPDETQMIHKNCLYHILDQRGAQFYVLRQDNPSCVERAIARIYKGGSDDHRRLRPNDSQGP
jgi:hypothetical protein